MLDFAELTLCDSLNSNPCLVNIFINSFAISPSIVGTILSRASTTVTFEPNLLHTEPISNPMYPPPITKSDFGILDRDRAPVEDTICFSSTGMFGISIEDDPVAIIKFLALAVISFFPFVI